ncbi:NAC domain-containing protein 35 [Juglans microcarpa x Juglans regia]|uniref:NAC domain-containing protein 35 n=1 Tax=Juglans microcarpa x Juglans regia TaxID=2249226 RepID=UPI001B7DF03F|nr:NAC domain-containing protein 35 [Juglans microcarpa x Juglans regia]
MSHHETNDNKTTDDDHEHDMVMPGFRFHPTEEELVEFYLRRKVEGKRFNVELITFLDLYRYDPWELPALAAIGEKEWFFYVPRDRKYRNGDRPNRVTTSGYWKATGADRMIRTENFRSIGLKKTLVFYSGKAPKGIRTSWIMNEYRLPQHETERYQKAEISLCRVYKRAGVEDHPSLPRSLPSRASSSRVTHTSRRQQYDTVQNSMENFQAFGGQSHEPSEVEKINETDGSSTSDITTALGLSKPNAYRPAAASSTTLGLPAPMEEEGMALLHHTKQSSPLVNSTCATLFTGSLPSVSSSAVDDLHRLVNYQQAASSISQQQHYYNGHHHPSQLISNFPPHSQPLALNTLPNVLPTAFSDRILWDWNPIPEANREYTNLFK